ncbi:unnamed protein product [Cladocopium goreaui]|uniref:Uncharacterized protein n=1 Tax=Cladocopium goreaui TaxID=2562237 RepID=A0A9P1G0S7_9DINO|nr:unnamed protein product [Cladocopium goreaui]
MLHMLTPSPLRFLPLFAFDFRLCLRHGLHLLNFRFFDFSFPPHARTSSVFCPSSPLNCFMAFSSTSSLHSPRRVFYSFYSFQRNMKAIDDFRLFSNPRLPTPAVPCSAPPAPRSQ